ncbi:hypothetical protein FE773_00845 [Caminibacter mediatlanticus TB-2]|uniref:Uncharacterized protein n=1 Tax=Caminibacter mediatlanticus TB-2 TaxID=391592 RepID=A0ABX5VA98_9BACT|nr:hypothetical protein [Caminibacter mediatlanticus]QCT93774.1 hypothetical protein FE773_00845 [Caminibacter mediatlanticus TB-2]
MKNTRSIILDSEYIVRDIEGVGMLLQMVSSELYSNGDISKRDYLAIQVLVDKLLGDIAPRTNELIEASYSLLKAQK